MTEIRGTITLDVDQLARHVTAAVVDALNQAEFADAVAAHVSRVVTTNVEPIVMQGQWLEFVQPAWSGWCWTGEHDRCDGTAPPSERGCACPHHRGEPVGRWRWVPASQPGERGHTEPREAPGGDPSGPIGRPPGAEGDWELDR